MAGNCFLMPSMEQVFLMHSMNPELFDVITISYGLSQRLIGGWAFAKIYWSLAMS